ncbi:MAG: hypothetical protein QOF84_6178, partial [Streptomyces sp.]|nr:hypothetical protein [Streptomyces sp.]
DCGVSSGALRNTRLPSVRATEEAGSVSGSPRPAPRGAGRGVPVVCQPSIRCWVQNEVRSVLVAAWAAALNSDVVETPYQCEVA